MRHSTAVAGLVDIKGGDDRFYNDVLVGEARAPRGSGHANRGAQGLASACGRDDGAFPMYTGGNMLCNGAAPFTRAFQDVTLPG